MVFQTVVSCHVAMGEHKASYKVKRYVHVNLGHKPEQYLCTSPIKKLLVVGEYYRIILLF